MALFTPGPAVAAVSGSVGGTTFSRNRYGAYMRFRAKPTVSQTEKAIAAKARLTAASQAWQALTLNQQTSWNFFARSNPVTGRLGFPQELTGHAAYVGIYTRMSMWGLTPLTAPPTSAAPPPLTAASVVADKTLGTCNVTFAATPTGADDAISAIGCYIASPGKHYVQNLYRFIGGSGVAQASPVDFFTAVESSLGTMTIGQRLILEVSVFDTVNGLLSAPLRCEDTIV